MKLLYDFSLKTFRTRQDDSLRQINDWDKEKDYLFIMSLGQKRNAENKFQQESFWLNIE